MKQVFTVKLLTVVVVLCIVLWIGWWSYTLYHKQHSVKSSSQSTVTQPPPPKTQNRTLAISLVCGQDSRGQRLVCVCGSDVGRMFSNKPDVFVSVDDPKEKCDPRMLKAYKSWIESRPTAKK